MKKILIIGGGFGGVRTALDLARARLPDVKITLVSDRPHFEYYPALYRVVVGSSPLEVCIPLRDIFGHTSTEVVEDRIESVDVLNRTALGSSGSRYKADFLVIALGSETEYYGIPGLSEWSFGFKSIAQAIRLKSHLHETFAACARWSRTEQVCASTITVVGAGASGVEVAGVMASYARRLAVRHGINPSMVTIELFEARERVLPAFPEHVSHIAEERLRKLGINIFLNRRLEQEDVESIHVGGMSLATRTVIWDAGVKPHHLYSEMKGLQRDESGRVYVDDFLQARGFSNVFIIGDGADTPHSGTAQTALSHGKFVASHIAKKIIHRPLPKFIAHIPAYIIPIGDRWAVGKIGSTCIEGLPAWVLRRAADMRFFLSILPLRKALNAWQSEKTLCESCSICAPVETDYEKASDSHFRH